MTTQTFLELESGEGDRSRVPLTSDTHITIGRHPDNVLQIHDERASRFHCVIEARDGGFIVRDLESRNGTILNDKPVTTSELKPGDVVKIGRVKFRYVDTMGIPELDDTNAGGVNGHHQKKSASSASRHGAPTSAARSNGASRHGRSGSSSGGGGGKSSRHGSATTGGGAARSKTSSTSDVAMISTEDIGSLAAQEDLSPLDDVISINPAEMEGEAIIDMVSSIGQVISADGLDAQPVTAAGRAAPQPLRKGPSQDIYSEKGLRLVRKILVACIAARATDLHVEPGPVTFRLRLRVDGTMIDLITLGKIFAAKMMGLFKVLAGIDVSQAKVVQEGHFHTFYKERRIDYRVSFTPAMHGQKLVIRCLDVNNAPQHMTDLQLPQDLFDRIRKLSNQDAGMMVTCGPTGSGKTTTLYSILRDLDSRQRNIVTIEDPVEYYLEGVTQIPIDSKRGNTFSHLLRSVLRQDPDIILLGEVRDSETAAIALQAAASGHLMLTTVHAKNSIGAIFRLLDLGVEPFLVASSLNLICAQRLCRKLCPHCKAPQPISDYEKAELKERAPELTETYHPVGCRRCFNTGYYGRRAIFELLIVTDDLRDVILRNAQMSHIRDTLKKALYCSLRGFGCDLVAQGITSLAEIDRVAGSVE